MMCFHASSTNTAGAGAGITHWAGLCVQTKCEFVAEGISKVHVQKADKEEDCWRYMLRWRRLPHVNTQVTRLYPTPYIVDPCSSTVAAILKQCVPLHRHARP